jgi:anti-anti-sigma factor
MTDGPQVSIDGQTDGIVVAAVSGEIDMASAKAVGGQLSDAVPNQALGLVVDLSGTSYLDSSGISLIFELAERLRRRQQQLMLVVPPHSPIRRVLNIVAAGGVVPMVETVEDATLQIRAAA